LWAKAWGKALSHPKIRVLLPEIHRVRYTDGSRATASWKEPILELSLKKDPAITSDTLIHEFGHVLATHKNLNLNPWGESTPGGNAPFISEYAEMNVEEDFAESFLWCIVRPSQLKAKCPQKYLHLTNLI
jgi:hypothetical protein